MENLEVRIAKSGKVVNLSKLNSKYGKPEILELECIKFYEYKIEKRNFLGMIINTENYIGEDSSGKKYNIIVEARGKSKKKSKNLIREFQDSTGLKLKIAEEDVKKRSENIILCKNFLKGCQYLDNLSVGMDIIPLGDRVMYGR